MIAGTLNPACSAKAVVNLSACRHNLLQAKKAAPDSKIIAIIKANAYGHGLEQVAHALKNKANVFGVARLEEAIQLRESGITIPIMLLEGFSSSDEIIAIQKHQLEPVIHHESQYEMLKDTSGEKITAWIKIDSGMHRLGFQPAQRKVIEKILGLDVIEKPVRFMTHLSDADDKYNDKTLKQINEFFEVVDLDKNSMATVSIANSAGILGWPQAHASYNRPGIMLYGVSPFLPEQKCDFDLKAVMTLSSKLISVKKISKGESIGYGSTYTCDKDKTIGIVAIGYGDGYPRHAGTGTPVLVNGKRTQLLGRVSMDMICVDLDEQPNAVVGDSVILWGEGLAIEEVAEHAGTIAYELLCGVTQRVKFEYHELTT